MRPDTRHELMQRSRWLRRIILAALPKVHAGDGAALPGAAAEGVTVSSGLSGRPKGVGVPFEQRRAP